MKIRSIIFICFIILSGCGDNSPFDEDYWEEPQAEESEGDSNDSNSAYSVTLQSLSSSVGTVSGSVVINMNQTDVTTSTELNEIPHTLMIGQRSISNLSCTDIASSYPPPDITTSSVEFRDLSTSETSSVESLITELNQADPSNGDALNLEGKSYVVKAYVQTINTPIPQTTTLIPIACGTIVATSSTPDEGETTGSTIGTTIGNTIGESAGGSIGGIGGTTGTTVGSTIGSISGAVGGSIGTTIGGVTGSVGGSIGGTVGGTVGGTAGGTTGSIGTGTTFGGN